MKKQHYYLVAGLVIFQTKDGEAGQIMTNGIVVNDNKTFPARLIGKAQQILQMNFFKRLDDPSTTVVDVPIYSISYLGLMTEKEFDAAPEGMQLQERVVADPFADPDKPKLADTERPTVN